MATVSESGLERSSRLRRARVSMTSYRACLTVLTFWNIALTVVLLSRRLGNWKKLATIYSITCRAYLNGHNAEQRTKVQLLTLNRQGRTQDRV